jgi:putative peptidoglycan lipid II flippase
LFAYGHFGAVDAGHLGAAIALSAFTLIPYALVLLQLRVFYAREQPWTPITVIVVITAVKVGASLLAPRLTGDRELVAGYLGLANGLGFLAGAVVGYYLLRRALRPAGHLLGVREAHTILVTLAASLLAGLVAHVGDRLLGLTNLTTHWGGAGSLLRLSGLAVIMLPITAAVMVRGGVPEAQAALAVIRRRISGSNPVASPGGAVQDRPSHGDRVTYSEHRNSCTPGGYRIQQPIRREPPRPLAGANSRKGPEVTDRPSDSAASRSASEPGLSRPAGITGSGSGWSASSPTGPDGPVPAADDFQPDIPVDFPPRAGGGLAPPVPSTVSNGEPSAGHAAEDANGLLNDPLLGSASATAAAPPAGESSDVGEDVQLVPGARIAGGRYRLLVSHGGVPPLQFWQALDTALNRQVALTFVDPDRSLPVGHVREILARTSRLSRVERPGVARVLDVLHTGNGGLIVAEWIRGGSLREVAETRPSPVGAARAMQSLAAAADAAHHAGVALSIDHPSRVRVSIEGEVVLAFPATLPDASPEDDIRGIGAGLYALLVNRWPLTESGSRSGLAPARRDAAGHPVEPILVNPDVPFQISAAAVHAIQEDGGIRSASTFLNLLQQATEVADRTELISPVTEPPGRRGRFGSAPLDAEGRARRRRNLLIGLGAAGAIVIVALLVIATVLGKIFGNLGGGLDKDRLGLNGPSSTASASAGGPGSPGDLVRPVKATVFSPGGDADEPGQAGLAIDGNPATAWSTDTYHDAVPFPGFKNGVGLILQLPKPTAVGTVNLDTAATGTKVQIRSSSTASPAKLEDTAAMTAPTAVHAGHNSIPVKAAPPTSYLLVWISTLGTTNGESRADLSEVTVQPAS